MRADEDTTAVDEFLRRCHRLPGARLLVVLAYHHFIAGLRPDERREWPRARFIETVARRFPVGRSAADNGRLAIGNLSLDRPRTFRRDASGNLEKIG